MRPNSGKICLRFLAQGADHEMSADWLVAGPRGRKNPEPGQQNFLFVFSNSSLLFYSLSRVVTRPVSRRRTLGEESPESSPCLYPYCSTFLWVHLAACYQAPFFIYPALASANLFIYPALISANLFITRRFSAPILILIKYLLPPLSRLLCAWLGIAGCLLSLPRSLWSANLWSAFLYTT